MLETARASPWDALNSEWAASQKLPPGFANDGWRLAVQVESDASRPLLKRVSVQRRSTPRPNTALSSRRARWLVQRSSDSHGGRKTVKIRPSCLEAPCPDRRPAFTLIELLAVMGTMGIVLLLATATLGRGAAHQRLRRGGRPAARRPSSACRSIPSRRRPCHRRARRIRKTTRGPRLPYPADGGRQSRHLLLGRRATRAYSISRTQAVPSANAGRERSSKRGVPSLGPRRPGCHFASHRAKGQCSFSTGDRILGGTRRGLPMRPGQGCTGILPRRGMALVILLAVLSVIALFMATVTAADSGQSAYDRSP